MNSEEHNLDELGALLPELRELVLDDSHIPSFRDLGRHLSSLRILSISRCGLQDLDGLTEAMPQLEELYASYNQLTDTVPLGYHPCLTIVQLQGYD